MPPKKKVKTTKGNNTRTPSVPTRKSARAKKPANAANPPNTNANSSNAISAHGKRDGLGALFNGMPVDVVVEIFCYLNPLDLVILTMTSKAFRSFLLGPDGVSFWERSRRIAGGEPVDKPAHLSEPEFAVLLFSNHCHKCLGRDRTVRPAWEIFARYCDDCNYDILTDVVPFVFLTVTGEMGVTEEQLLNNTPNSHNKRLKWYYRPQMQKFESRWAKIPKRDKKAFIQEHCAFVKQAKEHGARLRHWHARYLKKTSLTQGALVRERQHAILARLREEGWRDELDKIGAKDLERLFELEEVSRAVKLTEKEWATARPTIVTFMEDLRRVRVESRDAVTITNRLVDFKSILDKHQHSRWPAGDKNRIYASFTDCALMPEVRAIIEDMSAGVTNASTKASLELIIPDAITRWIAQRRNEYTAHLRAGLGKSDAAKVAEPLDLAIAFFDCHTCRSNYYSYGGKRLHRWPHIIEHSCFRGIPRGPDNYTRCVIACLGRTPRDAIGADLLHIGVQNSGLSAVYGDACDIIKACGRNPDTATYAEMQQCGIRLRCRLCARLTSQDLFDWQTAIWHDLEEHDEEHRQASNRWEAVPQQLGLKARELEDAQLSRPLDFTGSRTWYYSGITLHCAWCGHRGRYLDDHLLARHGKKNGTIDVDYYVNRKCERRQTRVYTSDLSHCKKEMAEVEAGKAFFATF